MVADAQAERLAPRPELIERWLFPDRESVEKQFGMELEKVKELNKTDQGKKQLLEHMKSADPSLNGNIGAALEQVNQNIAVLEKKESFLKKMIKLPVRAVEAVGRAIKKHPIVFSLLVAAGVAAGVGLYYGQLGNLLTQMIPNYAAEAAEVASESAGVSGDIGLEGAGTLSEGIVGPLPPTENPAFPLPELPGQYVPEGPTGTAPGIFASPNSPTLPVAPPPPPIKETTFGVEEF